jgi:nucleotide-binding universal stress UspA family protein
MNAHYILVPVDFTEYSENALLHAIEAGHSWKTGIQLLHLVKNEEDVEAGETKLLSLIQKHSDSDVPMIPHCMMGKPIEIGKIAEEKKAALVFMGTNGGKGWADFFGPGALRVSYESPVPIIITHLSPIPKDIKTVIVPIDRDVANKQILQQVVRIGKFWKCNVVLVAAGYDDEFHKNRVHRNLNFAKNYLADYHINTSEEHTYANLDYTDQILKISKNHKANLIAFIAKKGSGIFNFGTNGFDEKLLTNEMRTPILISTPNEEINGVDLFHVYQ